MDKDMRENTPWNLLTTEERQERWNREREEATRWIDQFPLPQESAPGHQLQDIYRAQRTPLGGRYGPEQVLIQRRSDEGWDDVYAYERPGTYGAAFHPFRQLRDGEWRHYAFITPQRTGFSIIDLAEGTIVAALDPAEARGFMPREFWTYDFQPLYGEDDCCAAALIVEGEWDEYIQERPWAHNREDVNELAALDNQFALVSGHYQVDVDPNPRARYIDLSQLSTGTVATDGRFGEPNVLGIPLAQSVVYHASMKRVEIAIPHLFELDGAQVWPRTT